MENMSKQINQPSFTVEANRLKEGGFIGEIIGINKFVVERSQCKRCLKRELVYHGFSSKTHTLTYGVCACGFWKRFWSEPTKLAKTQLKAA